MAKHLRWWLSFGCVVGCFLLFEQSDGQEASPISFRKNSSRCGCTAVGRPIGNAAAAVPLELAAGTEWMCIDSLIATYPSYCQWRCYCCTSGNSRTRYDTCKLSAGDCTNPTSPSCVTVSMTTQRADFVSEGVSKNGLKDVLTDAFSPTMGDNSKILASHLAEIEVAKGTIIYTKLFLILDQFPKRPTYIDGSGVEIKKPAKIDFKVPYDPKVISVNGKVVSLNFGGADYTVVCNTAAEKLKGKN